MKSAYKEDTTPNHDERKRLVKDRDGDVYLIVNHDFVKPTFHAVMIFSEHPTRKCFIGHTYYTADTYNRLLMKMVDPVVANGEITITNG